jgi:hypothetical protein
MTNPDYSAKPVSDWTEDNLCLFSIRIINKDLHSFFGCSSSDLPMPLVASPITFQSKVNIWNQGLELLPEEWEFLEWLDRAAFVPPECNPTFVPSMRALLKALHYQGQSHLLCSRKETKLFMCGKWFTGNVDMALIDFVHYQMKLEYLLLVLEDKVCLKPLSVLAAYTH